MTTQELKCFLCVAERLNFSKAAEELYLTPPTVTHHIQKLEEELGAQLFYRDSKSVRLTAEGEAFYQDAQEIMMRTEDALAHLKDMKAQKQSMIRIGCTTAPEVALLEKSLTLCRERLPTADPRILISDFSSLLRLLKEQHLDLLLGSRDMIGSVESCCFTPLFSCASYAVFRKDSPIPSQTGEVSLKDLEPFPLLVLRHKNVPMLPNDRIEQFLNERHPFKRTVRQSDSLAVLTLARSGYGVGILPQYALSNQDRADLICLKIKESSTIDYGLIWQKDVQSPIVKEFISILCEQEY